MKVTESLAKEVNVQKACAALAVPRASFYRWQDRKEDDREERVVPPDRLKNGLPGEFLVLKQRGGLVLQVPIIDRIYRDRRMAGTRISRAVTGRTR